MKLTDFVVPEAIIIDLKARKKPDAIQSMVNSLQAAGAIPESDAVAIYAAIMKREELGSTGIGNGVAVPHTKHAGVAKLVATVAISKTGVDFASLDGNDVHILFLLVSPPDRPGDHLRGLETISRHLREQTFCRLLKQTNSAEDVLELLREADQE